MGAVASVALPKKIGTTKARELLGDYFDDAKWMEITQGTGELSSDELLQHMANVPDDGVCEKADSSKEGSSKETLTHQDSRDDLSLSHSSQYSSMSPGRSSEGGLTPLPEGALLQLRSFDYADHHEYVAEKFFENLREFFEHKREIDALWESLGCTRVQEIAAVDNVCLSSFSFNDLGRQLSSAGVAVTTISELYTAAAQAQPAFEMVMRRVCKAASIPASNLKLAPLKRICRTLEKAEYEYVDRPGAPISWVSDVVRCSVYCDTEDQAVDFLQSLQGVDGIQVIKIANRFKHPTPAGFRDINVKLRIEPAVAAPALSGDFAKAVVHICEVQIHLYELARFSKQKGSHRFYTFFRHYFRGRWKEVSEQCRALESLLAAGPQSLNAAVTSMLDDAPSSATIRALAQLADDTLGMHAIAAKLYERLADVLAHETNNKRHVSVGIAHMHRGYAFLHLESYAEATGAFKLALTALQTHPEKYVTCITGWGRTLVGLGDFDAAMRTYSQALRLLKQTNTERYVGVVLSARMELQVKKGCYDEALDDISAAEAKLRQLVSREGEQTSSQQPRERRGSACLETPDEGPDIGLCWLQRSKALYAKAIEAGAAENLVLKAKLVDDALSEVSRARDLLHRVCGDMSMHTGEAYLQKARILLLRDNPGDASTAVAHASSAVERMKGHQLPYAHEVHAQALEKIKRSGDARASRRAAIAMLRANNNKGSEGCVRIMLADSAAYLRESDVRRALDLAETCLTEAIACHGESHLIVVDALRHLAKLHEEANSLGKGIDCLERAIASLYCLLGGDRRERRGSFDERFGIHGFMLKGPPAMIVAAGETHYAVACLAELAGDRKKAERHYETAKTFLLEARGPDCLAGKRIDDELERLARKGEDGRKEKVRHSSAPCIPTQISSGSQKPRTKAETMYTIHTIQKRGRQLTRRDTMRHINK